ncbi:MAG: chromosomal replication initiator protein DnaA [Spirochaetales bacterium]|nr:chromosomal replication initiator protein DnaA [Spirochaetales bacterium]
MDNNENWDWSDFWTETLNQMRHSITEQERVMWFSSLEYSSGTENSMQIAVPSSFCKDQISQRYGAKIADAVENITGKRLTIEFKVIAKQESQPIKQMERLSDEKTENTHPPNQTAEVRREQTDMQPENSAPVPKPEKIYSAPVPRSEKPYSAPAFKNSSIFKHNQLNPDYTFDSFIIGDSNSFAANAAYAISKNPGTAYNPCLFYGGVGLGKTHLIQSIGHSVFKDNPDLKIVYVTAESFTNEFLDMLGKKKMHQFKNKYRTVDVLLIDDIHFLQNKEGTQEELFHTFNALYESKKQIVFTCDRPVSELKNLADRLRSRFERGLNVDLKPPDLETRQAILIKKMESRNVSISKGVIELICQNITTNVRDLESALLKLIAYAELVHKDITVDIATEQLKDHFTESYQSNISVDLIQRIVADYFNIGTADLKSKKRTKAVTLPRQIAMYILRELTEYSTTEIGYEFGGRDHTTVMHACQRMESRMKTESSLEPTINNLIRTVKDDIKN